MAFLDVKKVSFVYGPKTPYEVAAVNEASFTAERGEIIGIIGHTGSGKSTLVQMLNGLIKPTGGSVFIDGQDIWADPKKVREIRFRVGLVFQYPEHQLFDETVYKDIAFGPTNMGLSESEIEKRVRMAAEFTGVEDDILFKSPFDLSGGQQRRVAVAGVLAMNPEILVLDEPTAGLDPKGKDMLIRHILNYRDKFNATVIIVSHSMEDIARIADKVLVMNDGNSVMFDSVKNVFSRVKELNEMGLSVPSVTNIAAILKNNGISIPDCFTVEETVTAIKTFLKGRDNNA